MLSHNAMTAIMAPSTTATIDPGARRGDPAPLKGVMLLVGEGGAATIVPMVVAAGASAAAVPLVVAVAITGLGLPAAKPTLGVLLAPGATGAVVNCTCGTVTTVLTVPVVRVIVVIGIEGAAAAVMVDTMPAAAVWLATGVLMGVGQSVIVDGTLVMIPGFWLT